MKGFGNFFDKKRVIGDAQAVEIIEADLRKYLHF
jgi:hypothetical protein